MTDTRIPVFFYGSFMNKEVLAKGGFIPNQIDVARLSGFDIRIYATATLIRSDRDCVYGIICYPTRNELNLLYRQDWLNAYAPEAVLVELLSGVFLAALCYIAPAGPPSSPADDYLDRILSPAREYGFPDWYLRRLEKYRNRIERLQSLDESVE
jgi:hypothetical protein